MHIQDVVREFIFEITLKNYTAKTIKGYKNNILKFTKYIADECEVTELEEVSHIHIKKYLSYLQEKGLSEVYINSILKNIRSFFKYCQQEDYCSNVAKKVSWLKEGKTIIKTFEDEEIKKMLNSYKMNTYMNARNKCIIAVLIDTGVRNFELCSLTMLDVRETVIYIKGKGNKERVVPISPYLKKIMIKYERVRNNYLKDNILHYNNYFLSYRNKPLTNEAIERIVKIAGGRANVRKDIRCSPHTIRHYFAQAQLKNGLDVYSLSRVLGHESIAITKRYLQSLEDKNIVKMSVKTSPLMNLR